MSQHVRSSRQPLAAIAFPRENTPSPRSHSSSKPADQENVSPRRNASVQAHDPTVICVEFPPGPMGLDLEPVIVSSQRKIGCRIKGFQADQEHHGIDPIKLRKLVKVGDIVKEINGTQVLSAPFAVILDTLRQLRRVTRTVVFKDLSANWSEGAVNEPREQSASFSPSSVKKHTKQRASGTTEKRPADAEDPATNLVWRYMQNMVAPFAEKVERAAQSITASAAYIPTVTSTELAQVMQSKNQLLQELAEAYNQLERVDQTNHQLVQQHAEEGRLQHLVELDRQSLLGRCGWLEQQVGELQTHKAEVCKQWQDTQLELERTRQQAEVYRQTVRDLENRLERLSVKLSQKDKECSHQSQKIVELQNQLDEFSGQIHTHPLVVELEQQMQRLRSDVEQAHRMLAAERERQHLEQQQMIDTMRARDTAVVEELSRLQSEHAALYDQHQSFVNERQRETLDWHAQLQNKDTQLQHQRSTIDVLRQQLVELQAEQQASHEEHAARVATLNKQLQEQTTSREHERASHDDTVQQLQHWLRIAVERQCMASEDACSSQARHSELLAQLETMQTRSTLQATAYKTLQQQLRETTAALSIAHEEHKDTVLQLQEELRQQHVANKELHVAVTKCNEQRSAVEQDRQAILLHYQALAEQLKSVKEARQQAAVEYEQRMAELETELKELRGTHAEEMRAAREENMERVQRLQHELAQVHAAASATETSHAEELRGLQRELQQCRLARDAALQAQQSTDTQLRTAQTTVRELRSSLNVLKAKATELRRELAKQQSFVTSQLKAHEVSLKHLADSVTARIRTLEKQWKEQLQRERQRGESQRAELDAAHKAQLKTLECAHASTMQETTQQHNEYLQQLHENVAVLQERLKELEEEEQRSIGRVVAKEDARRARLQAEHEREISELHAMFETQLDQLIQTHRRELAAADQALKQARQAGEERLQQATHEHMEATDRLLADLNAARDSIAGMMATIQAQELALMHAMEQIAAQQFRHSGDDDRADHHDPSKELGVPSDAASGGRSDDSYGIGQDELQKLVEERDRLLASMAELEDNHAALQAAFVRQKQELEDVRLLVEAITNDDGGLEVPDPPVERKSSHSENDDADREARLVRTSGAPLTRLALKKRRRPVGAPHGTVKETTMQTAIASLLSRRLQREILRFSFLRWRHAQLQQIHYEHLSAHSSTSDESADTSRRSVAVAYEVGKGAAEGESFWTVSTTDSEHTGVFHNFV